jgi:exodeoxyribonuclease VII small subunit
VAAKKLKFEEAMQRLQEIVGKLESGEESLEDSMKLFQEGAKLSAQCYQMLDKAEQQVAQLTKIADSEEEEADEPDL